MKIKYRTFQDGDEEGIIKLFNSAFCKTRFCQPNDREYWEWKYKTRPPRFIPEGIMLAEKKGIIVGCVIVTFHKMRFGAQEYLLGGIDDVSTCPILEKRGIARNLMEKAIEFTTNYGADGSVLIADPRGHARRLYKNLGYDNTTYYSMFFKFINPLKLKNEVWPLVPLIPLIYLAKLKVKRKKKVKSLQLEIIKDYQQEFIDKLHQNNERFVGGVVYDKNYWYWARMNRPRRYRSVVLVAKKGNKLIGGGSILKSNLLALKYNISLNVLSDLFVNPEMKDKGIGYALLQELEKLANDSPIMIAFVHKYNHYIKQLLTTRGYFSIRNTELEMIKPISREFTQVYESLKKLKKPWLVPLENAGF